MHDPEHSRQRARWGRPDANWPDEWLLHERRRASPRTRLLLPVVLSLLIQLPASLFWLATQGPTQGRALTLLLAILGPLALLGARRYPGPVVLVVSILGSLDFFVSQGFGGPPYVALVFAIIGALVRGARVWAWVSVGSVWAITLGTGILLGREWHPGGVAVTTLGILVLFGIGESMRSRREMLAEYRRTIARRRQSEAQAERVRLARELHDVLAHSLSQINVQAGVGLHLMERQPEKAAEALANIKNTSKTALDEVRSVLGVLRSTDRDPDAPLLPEPDLSRLPSLIAPLAAQGLDVTLEGEIVGAPQSVQLALYRIAQESLTNVVRHADATRAVVRLASTESEYSIRIDDDGRGFERDEASEGRGILGMSERAELLGGRLEIGSSQLGGSRITATIPVEEHP
ncbi:signal transduction histidine kinase [Microbacteriaceae bacterium SG_E_30_P1]|uniref:histidine kinase n=1 Tax=Antiquaquibacter oligotrophicus TaxID=2880260 RepID=A0ABT6KM75_9MICO|nr:sensor histidine kinase [Antiquaquibacter oligotrophicus]MDH6181113.1 signal transduction histidine kinase [Antiquaquibacter oligotrophicus]UDF13189.1 sensor histidine kinase [Antiquaquibacter oligotrophicus]